MELLSLLAALPHHSHQLKIRKALKTRAFFNQRRGSIVNSSDTRNAFIHEFTQMKSFHDIAAIDELALRIKAYISMAEADTQLESIMIVLDAVKEDYISSNFAKCSKIAKPIFDWAKNQSKFEYLDTIIVGMVLHHAPNCKLAIQLAKELIDTLKNKYADKKHKTILLMIYMHMTYRLLRAMYYEIKDRVRQKTEFNEVTSLLGHYAKVALVICKEYSLHDYKEVILIRLALANANCAGITNGLHNLKKLGAHDWLKTSRDEVDEYLTFFNDRLTTALRNLRTGVRIQKCRLAIDMTVVQLADMLDISHTQINAYETGERGMRRTRLVQIADILGASVTYLSGEDKTPPKLIDNVKLHKLHQVACQGEEEDQEFLLDFAIRFIKHQNKICKEKNGAKQ